MGNLYIFGAEYLFLFIPVLALWDFLKKNSKDKKYIITLGFLAALIAYGIGHTISLLYYDPRPFVVYHFTPLILHAADNGFPSDHTLVSATIASVVFCYNKYLGLFLEFIAILVGISRILVGVHSVIDVTGSLIIAALGTFLAALLLKKNKSNKG